VPRRELSTRRACRRFVLWLSARRQVEAISSAVSVSG
jgi:hypothetical protein